VPIEILDVGFDKRVEIFQPFGHLVFVLDDLVEDLIGRWLRLLGMEEGSTQQQYADGD
jgi:hypothetical protein